MGSAASVCDRATQERKLEEGRIQGKTMVPLGTGTVKNNNPNHDTFDDNDSSLPISNEPSASSFQFDLDERITEKKKERIKKLIKTVNDLTRRHEILACLRDNNIPLEEKQEALRAKNSHGVTALFWAVRRRVDHTLLEEMVEIGGEILVRETNTYGENILHCAAFCGAPTRVFQILGDVGGTEALLAKDRFGNTPMHYACNWGASIETLFYFIEKGGQEVLTTANHKHWVPSCKSSELQVFLNGKGGDKYEKMVGAHNEEDLTLFDMIMSNYQQEFKDRLASARRMNELYESDSNKLSLLMVTLWFRGNAPPSSQHELASLAKLMIEIGGKKLILMENETGSNALHYAAFNNAPLDIIKLMVETAGNDIIHKHNGGWRNTPLHDACFRQAHEEVIEYLVRNDRGNKAVLAKNKDGKIPLDLLFDADTPSDSRIMAFQRAWYDVDPRCARTLSRHIVSKILTWCMQAGTDSSRVTSNNFVKSLLNQRFILSKYQMVIMMDLYVQLAIVAVLSPLYFNDMFLAGKMDNIWLGIFILAICFCWLLGREFAQIYSSPLGQYVVEYDNYIDLAQIILVALVLSGLVQARDLDDIGVGSGFRGVVVSAIAIVWLNLLIVIANLNYSVSVFTNAFAKVIWKLMPLALAAVVIVIAFSQMFYVAGSGMDCTGWQCNANSAFFQSSVMLLSTDWDFMDWNDFQWEGDVLSGSNNWLLTAVAFLFAIIIGILLLNMLIAVVSNVFTEVSEASENAFWETRLLFMVEINAIRRHFCIRDSGQFKLLSRSLGTESESVDDINRISFACYNDEWIQEECSEEDLERFFKWWYYSWRHECPPLQVRLHYFYKHASTSEIFFPGDVFMNILFGLKYNQKVDGPQAIIALAISYVHFISGAVCAILVCVLGLVTFGLSWTKEVREVLFFGPVDNESDKQKQAKEEIQGLKNTVNDLTQQVNSLQKQNSAMRDVIQKQDAEILDRRIAQRQNPNEMKMN